MSLGKENESGTLGISIIGGKVHQPIPCFISNIDVNCLFLQDSGSYGDIGIFVKTLAEGGAAHRVRV